MARVFTRQEFYDLVWSKPLTQLAGEFGLSDVALHKICRKHEVPNPPLGWWAKKAAGQQVKHTPLPKPKPGTSERIAIAGADLSREPDGLAAVREKARIIASSVSPDPGHSDPVVERTIARLAKGTGRLWTYVVDDRASGSVTPPLAWYRFTPDRTGVHPQKELAGFAGDLQADACAGYDKLYQSGRVTEVACWAHFRRKIFDIHKPRPTPLTCHILARIAALYGIEAEVHGQPPDQRRRARQDRTKPLIAQLRAVLDDAHRRLAPKSVMAVAIAYGTKRWTALTRFSDDGHLEIDNNIAERSLRSNAIGRKNWLFAGSKVGGERAAAIYTVIETCKMNGVEPQAYIADVIAKIAADWPAARWDELMPWNWKASEERARLAA